jgi:hypothetical protein
MKFLRLIWCVALPLIATPIARAGVLHSGASASVLVDCQSAAQQVQAGLPALGLGGAYVTLAACPVATSVPALTAAWTRIASGDEDIAWRGSVSVRFADRRILHAALAAGMSSMRSVEERTSALSTVMSLLTPGRGLNTTFWYHPQGAQPDVVADIDVTPGEQAITSSDRAAVVQALSTMASSDSDTQARLVAQRLMVLLQ